MNSPCVFRKRVTSNYLAFIEITNSCNMRCTHCMNWSVENSNEGFGKENILKLIKDLYDNNTEEIYIGETHDSFRGVQGAFDNCVKVFKLLKENNVKTRISAMIWKENVEQLEEIIY